VTESELEAFALTSGGKVTRTNASMLGGVSVEEKARRSKHGNRHVRLDGYTFDSEWESERYLFLKSLVSLGIISQLEIHRTFDLHCPSGEKITWYEADFVYVRDGEQVVEDCKGHLTDMYKLKRRWMKAEYGIVIQEVYKGKRGKRK
jgi:hypothetical protein